jgi:hypothetical protein
MLPRLIDHRRGQQLCRIELADRKAFKPGFLPARQAVKLRPAHVPQLDVYAVRAALAEQQDRHPGQSSRVANKRQSSPRTSDNRVHSR